MNLQEYVIHSHFDKTLEEMFVGNTLLFSLQVQKLFFANSIVLALTK